MPSIRIEGEKTYENAFASKKEFIENCDSVCTIFNDKIVDEISESTFFTQLEQGNKEIGSIVSDFVDIISGAGEINIDFNDLKSFLTGNESSEGNKAFFHTKIIIDENVKDFSSLSSLVKEKINKSYSNGDFSSEKIDVLVNFKMGTSNKSDLVVNIKNILTDISSSSNIKLVYGIENTLETFTQISIFISTNEVSNYIPLKQDIQNDEVNANDKNVLNSSYSAKQAERNKTKNISKLLFDFDEFEK
jgi:cell division GTPase FtsZ